jgi:hypothetical protein
VYRICPAGSHEEDTSVPKYVQREMRALRQFGEPAHSPLGAWKMSYGCQAVLTGQPWRRLRRSR